MKNAPMDTYTLLTKAWLERRYGGTLGSQPGIYYAHEPIYGIGSPECEPNHVRRIFRLFQLLRQVREAGGATLLDVGGSEGYFAVLCRELFGMTTVSVDLSEEACRRGAEIFAMPGCAVDAACLPFRSGSFDVVTCAEVVEHLAFPVPAILEMQRVAAGTLILATEEWEESEEERDHELAERRTDPHGERSIFADADFEPLFAPYAYTFERQVIPDLSRFGDDRQVDLVALRAALLEIARGPRPGDSLQGIVLRVRKDAEVRRLPKTATDEQIVDYLLSRKVPIHRIPDRTPVVPWPGQFALRCVVCAKPLQADGDGFVCACGERYVRDKGVLSFLRQLPPFEQRIAAMLGERQVGHASQRADLLGLAKKLSVDFGHRDRWDLTGEDAKLWETNAHITMDAPGVYRVSGDDPWLQSPMLGNDMAKSRTVVVEFSVRADAKVPGTAYAEVFWLDETEAGFVQSKSAHAITEPDGVVRKVVFHAPDMPGKVLARLRLDPMSGGTGDVVVRSITIPG